MIYGGAQRGECTVVLMIIFKNSSRGFLPRTLVASPLNQRVASNKSNPEGNGRTGTLNFRIWLSSTLENLDFLSLLLPCFNYVGGASSLTEFIH